MSREKFLGATDLSTVKSLLKTYDVPTRIPDCVKLHRVKQQDDLILIELGSLLTSNECDEIVEQFSGECFESMTEKYTQQTRNNSRLIILDDRLGRTLWRRLKFDHKLTKLVRQTQPLGFNVQGQWKLNGINPAMRINKYKQDQFFAPHKDAQYAPSGDRRSLLSLIIYLNDDYKQGQTKFYFPRQIPTSDIKGLTIKEEIKAYNGLVNGYECITLEPKKGYAVLFSHNLLHEALSPLTDDNTNYERIILRTDVLVERTEKPMGFAVCNEEKQDYLACLNFFRQAQQCELNQMKDSKSNELIGELYERALSIRYCYPRLLEKKNINRIQLKSLAERLPSEPWLHIFHHLNEQDVDNLIYVDPDFQTLKIVWQVRENQIYSTANSKHKFLPSIQSQYGSRTLFRFDDAQFFTEHIEQCCRVVAVYAFYLLGHRTDAQTYTVRYNRDTQEVYEVETERLLYDVFYNRNCYGSLYRIKQNNEKEKQPSMDFSQSVDRMFMNNRCNAQFIGQDLLSRFYLQMEQNTEHNEYSDELNETYMRAYQRRQCLLDKKRQLIDVDEDLLDEYPESYMEDDESNYREELLDRNMKDHGSSICRMLSTNDKVFRDICLCGIGDTCSMKNFEESVRIYNHLIFDFDTHQLRVERLSDEVLDDTDSEKMLVRHIRTLKRSGPDQDPITFYRVNIEKLAEQSGGFSHASCQCDIPSVKTNQFTFLQYTYLSHVDLAVVQNEDHAFVVAMYDGIVAF